jgi:hypothetical protein
VYLQKLNRLRELIIFWIKGGRLIITGSRPNKAVKVGNVGLKIVDITGTETKNIWKVRFLSFQRTVTNTHIGDFRRVRNSLMKCDQPGSNLVRDEKFDLFAYSHSILSGCKNHFCRLLCM